MRRRIIGVIIAVTLLAVGVLTVPLAIVSSVRSRDDAVKELERAAERVATDVTATSMTENDEIELPKVEDAVTVGVYLPDGTLVAGDGPQPAGALVTDAGLLTRNADIGQTLVVARPIVADERVEGIIRMEEPLSETEGRIRRDLGLLLLFDVAAVAIAASAGWFLAARLVAPLEEISNDAVRLGSGDFAITERASGITELDATSAALADTAQRLDSTLRREREFTANTSHQLRTPLTALRLSIEGELLSPRADPSEALLESVHEIDRLESTITTLLEVARRRTGHRTTLDPAEWIDDLRHRWVAAFTEAGREIRFTATDDVAVQVSREVLDEISNVLIDNALGHGHGAVSAMVSGGSGSLTLAVTDEGDLGRDPSELFVRNDPAASGSGVGLALARSLAEGEGGRLVVSSTSPTGFLVVLADWSNADWGEQTSRP